MDDTIFKPLTHMDREGDQNLTSRFQRRETAPLPDDVFQNMDTDPETPQKGWQPDPEPGQAAEPIGDLEANGCWCPEDGQVDNVVYEETVIVEFYDDKDRNL